MTDPSGPIPHTANVAAGMCILGNGHARGSNLAQDVQGKNAELFMRYRGSRSVGEAGGLTMHKNSSPSTARRSAQVGPAVVSRRLAS
jgi:hypothetical protein